MEILRLRLGSHQCRTCYGSTNGLQTLTTLTQLNGSSGQHEQKSFAQLLKEITNINVLDDCCTELPQYICDGCIHKLKEAHAFVQQAAEVNKRLVEMASKRTEANKEADCLQETQVGVQEIKMEPDELNQNIIEDDNDDDIIEVKVEDTEIDDDRNATECFSEYILGATFHENAEETNDQSLIPRRGNSLHKSVSKPHLESSVSKPKEQNQNIFVILKQLNSQLNRIKQTEESIIKNQTLLIDSQNEFVLNQQQMVNKLEKIEASIVSKPLMTAQSKLQMECNVAIKKIEATVCRMAGETYDKHFHIISSLLPMKSLAEVHDLEHKLENPEFIQIMTAYLVKLKGTSEDVSSVIRSLFTDDLLEKYNWEGRWEKLALGKLTLCNKILRDVFQQQTAFEFEKSFRKAVVRSHHRMKQKKYLKKSN